MLNERALFSRESGQTVVESALGLLVICFMAAVTINVYYLVNYVQTIHASAYEGALAVAEGTEHNVGVSQITALATATSQSVVANTSLNPNAPQAAVPVCAPESGGGTDCPGFADPEAGSNGTETGQFTANSVATTQSFCGFYEGKPAWKGSDSVRAQWPDHGDLFRTVVCPDNAGNLQPLVAGDGSPSL